MVANSKDDVIKLATVTKLNDEIIRFDAILAELLEYLPQDYEAYEAVAQARDYIFRMEEKLRGCEIVHFCTRNPGGDI